jgi:hypothetical protein
VPPSFTREEEDDEQEAVTMVGIPASELSDEDLRRELKTLHETRNDTLVSGSRSALETHTRRTLELEQEFLVRFPPEARVD